MAVAGAALAAWVVPASGALGQRNIDPRSIVENACVPALKLTAGWCGDGGPARQALLVSPASLTVLPDGSVAFTDIAIAAVRRVRPDGVIERVAGTGRPGFRGDGGPATRARISDGDSIAALPDGGFLLTHYTDHRVRRVWPDGRITTVAGTGRPGFAGDGGPATQARLSTPVAVSALSGGGFLIVDNGNARVRRVDAHGLISTVAGSGRRGFAGDRGPATAARLNDPGDVAALPDGSFVFSDHGAADRLRKVTSAGVIDTLVRLPGQHLIAVATAADGTVVMVVDNALKRLGADGELHPVARDPCPDAVPSRRLNPGDGRSASHALLAAADMAVTADGSLVVADWMFARIRRIDPGGVVTTLAGGGGLTGRVFPRDSPCGGASPEYGVWNYFGIVRARGTRRHATVRFGTTLAARVTITARRGGRTVARRRLRVSADTHTVHLRLRPGRHRVVLRGRHASLKASDRAVVRVR